MLFIQSNEFTVNWFRIGCYMTFEENAVILYVFSSSKAANVFL